MYFVFYEKEIMPIMEMRAWSFFNAATTTAINLHDWYAASTTSLKRRSPQIRLELFPGIIIV